MRDEGKRIQDMKPRTKPTREAWIDELTAPCGMDCFNCELFESNMTESVMQSLALRLGRLPEGLPCRGCRRQDGCRLSSGDCPTRACARDRRVFFCFECRDFPCERFTPAVDGADRSLHNLKLFNLCRMKVVGLERWAHEESLMIRMRYLKGRPMVGCGPVIDEDFLQALSIRAR
jgi:hypothetical protein